MTSGVADFTWCTENHGLRTVLGELMVGQGDSGAGCHLRMTAAQCHDHLAKDSFLHVQMDADVPSTARPLSADPDHDGPDQRSRVVGVAQNKAPIQERLGDGARSSFSPSVCEPTSPDRPSNSSSNFADHYSWNVNAQCPRAQIYQKETGGTDSTKWPWLPTPVLGSIAGYDRTVKSTSMRRPIGSTSTSTASKGGAACFPRERWLQGGFTVAFGSVIYHSGIDESVTGGHPQGYLSRYSLTHTHRHFDNLGISNAVGAPAWDETLNPCTSHWLPAEQ